MGDDAVAGGEHVGQAGAHLLVDGDRALGAEAGAGGGGEVGVGADADHDEHEVDLPGDGARRPGGPSTCIAGPVPAGARVMAVTGVPVRTSTPWRSSSAWTSAPSSGSTVGRTSGSVSIWVTCRPRAVRASAISRPMYPAPTMTAAVDGVEASRVRGEGEGVAHGVQEVHAVVGAERRSSGR